MLLSQHIEFFDVKGVGHVDLKLSDKRMNVLIGANGVGKTKTLECLYTLLLFTNNTVRNGQYYAYKKHFSFNRALIDGQTVYEGNFPYEYTGYSIDSLIQPLFRHDNPVVYLGAQNRGEIKPNERGYITPLGEYKERQKKIFRKHDF